MASKKGDKRRPPALKKTVALSTTAVDLPESLLSRAIRGGCPGAWSEPDTDKTRTAAGTNHDATVRRLAELELEYSK